MNNTDNYKVNLILETLPATFAERVKIRIGHIREFEGMGCFHPGMYRNRRVLDWEAGDCAFSVAFLALGASEVVALDSWTDSKSIHPAIFQLSGFSFQQKSIIEAEDGLQNSGGGADFIFANTVTEHVMELAASFDVLRRILRPQGYFFNNHDNYYSPCGSHDHGFWFYGKDGFIEFQGVECWKSEDKCKASHYHRMNELQKVPWTWPAENNEQLTPEQCSECRYYKRSKEWAHLQGVLEFSKIYNHPSFLMHRPNSSINKVTPFQLLQLLSEAGFSVVRCERTYAANTPPENLLQMGLSKLDLTTTNIRTLCEVSK